MTAKLLKLVNQERNIEIVFTQGVEPRELLKQISESGNAGAIGLLPLRGILEGTLEEYKGFMILDAEGETADAAAVAEDVKVEVAETKSEEATESTAAGKVELSTETSASETETENKVEDVKVVCDETNNPADPISDAAVGTEGEQDKPSAKDAIKAAFGINIGDGGSPNLTPSGDVTPVKRPRRDLEALIKKAKAGQNKELIAAAEVAGYHVSNVQNEERWFGFTLPEFEATDRNAPRFDVSPLKNGAYSVSLYINDRATGIKERLVHETPVDKLTAAANVLEMMSSAKFADAVKAANYVKAVA